MHPDNNKIKVFINGRSKGSKVLIPSGGHTPPTGKRDEAKKAQKNATKNITSEAINSIIPYLRPI